MREKLNVLKNKFFAGGWWRNRPTFSLQARIAGIIFIIGAFAIKDDILGHIFIGTFGLVMIGLSILSAPQNNE